MTLISPSILKKYGIPFEKVRMNGVYVCCISIAGLLKLRVDFPLLLWCQFVEVNWSGAVCLCR